METDFSACGNSSTLALLLAHARFLDGSKSVCSIASKIGLCCAGSRSALNMESFSSSSEAKFVDSSSLDQNDACLDEWMDSDSVPQDSLSRKRARKPCLSQLLLEKAWAGLSEQLHKFRKAEESSMFIDVFDPKSHLQSSHSPVCKTNDMAINQHLSMPSRDGSLCMTENIDQNQVVGKGPGVKDIERRMLSKEDELETHQKVDDASGVAACLEAIVADVVKQVELSSYDARKAIKPKNNKVVRFAEDCVSGNCSKSHGCFESRADRQGPENELSSFSLQRALFTRRDMKEMEELLGESNKCSLIRLRRRVGLEPRRVPDLKFVTTPSHSSDRPARNTPWELRSHHSTRLGSINFCPG